MLRNHFSAMAGTDRIELALAVTLGAEKGVDPILGFQTLPSPFSSLQELVSGLLLRGTPFPERTNHDELNSSSPMSVQVDEPGRLAENEKWTSRRTWTMA